MHIISKLFFTIYLISFINAQFNFGFKSEFETSSNPFRSPIATYSNISSLGIVGNYQLDSTLFIINSDYYNFSIDPSRNFLNTDLSFTTTLNNFSFGLLFEIRKNKSEYEYFNYFNTNFFASNEIKGETYSADLTLNLGIAKFNNFNYFDNYTANVRLGLNKYFETKTSLIANLSYNYQNYYNTYLETKSRKPYYSLFSSNLRIAQSLFENTGIAYQINYNKMLSFDGNSLEKWNYGFGDETLLFDNFYSSEGLSHTFELTQILPLDFIFKTGFNYSEDNYPSQNIFLDEENMDFNILRKDYNKTAFFKLNKSILLNENNNTILNLNFSYYYSKNNSNSYWYKYLSNSFSIGASLEL